MGGSAEAANAGVEVNVEGDAVINAAPDGGGIDNNEAEAPAEDSSE